DAGVGKSRLCREFLQRCRARAVLVHEVHCPPHGATAPWLAAGDLLRSYFGLAEGDGVDGIRRRVAAELQAREAGLGEALPLVLELLGVGDPGAGSPPPESVTPPLAAFVRRFVPLKSAGGPVVVLLDDAHWIDRASAELVREIAASVRDTRTLLLANFRPEFQPAWIGGPHYQQLALAPLGEAQSREL